MKHSKRGQLMWDTLVPWIIAIAFLILALMIYLGLSGKLGSAGEFIRNFWGFGQ